MIEQGTGPLPLLSDVERVAVEECEISGPVAVRFLSEQRSREWRQLKAERQRAEQREQVRSCAAWLGSAIVSGIIVGWLITRLLAWVIERG